MRIPIGILGTVSVCHAPVVPEWTEDHPVAFRAGTTTPQAGIYRLASPNTDSRM